jgi:hypothetical protein
MVATHGGIVGGIFDRTSATCQDAHVTDLALLTRPECENVLATHIPVLNDCFEAAWTRWCEWLGKLDGSPGDVTPKTRAVALHDFIVSEVSRRLVGEPGVRLKLSRGLLTVCIQDRVAIRFKKFRGKSLRTASNSNMQTIAFDGHQLELPQGSLRPITHLVAGYLLDDLEAGIAKVAITCSVNGSHFWAPIEISAHRNGYTATTVHATNVVDPTITKPGVRSTRRKIELEGE